MRRTNTAFKNAFSLYIPALSTAKHSFFILNIFVRRSVRFALLFWLLELVFKSQY